MNPSRNETGESNPVFRTLGRKLFKNGVKKYD